MLVRGSHGTDPAPGQREVAAWGPTVTMDDGADLLALLHESGIPDGFLGATEETTTGLVRARALDLKVPVIALNEARSEKVFNDHYGTGQSTLDGILRATNILLAGARSWCSATAPPAMASPRAPGARGRRSSSARSTRCARSRRAWRASTSCPRWRRRRSATCSSR